MCKKGGHSIQTAYVLRRFDKRFLDSKKILPYCNEVEFFDNDNGFVKVAEYQNGELFVKSENPSEWLVELSECLKEM